MIDARSDCRAACALLCAGFPGLRSLPVVEAGAGTFIDASDQKESANRFWIIPHTHWEGAVFKTREEYPEEGFPN
jgi:hypothetical protein